jgi:invasion protein IalB
VGPHGPGPSPPESLGCWCDRFEGAPHVAANAEGNVNFRNHTRVINLWWPFDFKIRIRMRREVLRNADRDMTEIRDRDTRMDRFGSTQLAAARMALACCVITMATLVGTKPAAFAQGAVRSVHNDWQIRCETPPGAQNEQCALFQSVIAEDRANVTLTVVVLKTADQKSRLMRVVAPLGVLLPSGLGLKIDQTDVGRAGFVRCLQRGCYAEVVMDDNLLKQLRSGQTATFIIFLTPEEGIGFPMSLKGFGDGYDKLP